MPTLANNKILGSAALFQQRSCFL